MILIMNENEYQAKIRAMIPSNPDPNASFPVVLHRMLSEIDDLAQKDPDLKKLHQIVSWLDHGMAFKVHDRKKFISIVMPTWFVRLKHTSWVRQLNLYAFKRVQEGPDKGAIYHESFIRGRPDLARSIMKPTKKQKATKSSVSELPDFHCKGQGQVQRMGNSKRVMGSPASAPSLFDLEEHHRKTQESAGTGFISSCGVTFGQSEPPSLQQATNDPFENLCTGVFHPLPAGEEDSFSSMMPQQVFSWQDQFIAGQSGHHAATTMSSSVARMPVFQENSHTGQYNVGQPFPFPTVGTLETLAAPFPSPSHPSPFYQRQRFGSSESKETFEDISSHNYHHPFPLPTASALTASFMNSSQTSSWNLHPDPGDGHGEESFDLEPVPFAPESDARHFQPQRGPF